MNALLLNALKSPRQVFREEGLLFYLQLFEGEELEHIRLACENVYERFMETQDAEEARRAIVMRHLNDPQYHRDGLDGWKTIMETAADARCVGPMEQLFGGPSLFYSTSLFFNPREGRTEGDWHRDQQFILGNEDEVQRYFEGEQIRDGTKLGVQLQIALVDNEDIEYVPFSAARYDSPQEYYFRCADDRAHNREAGMPNAMRVRMRAGDAIAFNPAGLHRGRYYSDLARRTLMLTYTGRAAATESYFSYQPWMLEPHHLDMLSPRARVYYQEFIATYREFWLRPQAES